MIINAICRALADKVKEICPHVSLSGGLVTAMPGQYGALPVATVSPLHRDTKHMAPDNMESAIIWFESGPSMLKSSNRSIDIFTVDIRLVIWLNTNRITGELLNAEMSIINAVRGVKFDTENTPIKAANIEYTGEEQEGPQVFQRWAFDEAQNHLTLPPYRAAAHRFRVSYALARCADPVGTKIPLC